MNEPRLGPAVAPGASAPGEPSSARWLAVERCPACDDAHGVPQGLIPESGYAFGAELVPFPEGGIAVARCSACGLAYKTRLPQPAYLSAVFEKYAPDKWRGRQDLADEAATLKSLSPDALDLLDVGAADGALLEACARLGTAGRRSALDVMRYPGAEAQLRGEFISGFLDSPMLEWSGRPYGMVAVFDVLEHLYRPRQAFANLRALVRPGGLVLIETGNAESDWPRRFGLHHWWYVRLFEHHVFLCLRALERIAARHGFEIVLWEEARHKSRRHASFVGIGEKLLKAGLYRLVPDSYTDIARWFGKRGNQPWHPFAKDHFRACLRRTSLQGDAVVET